MKMVHSGERILKSVRFAEYENQACCLWVSLDCYAEAGHLEVVESNESSKSPMPLFRELGAVPP